LNVCADAEFIASTEKHSITLAVKILVIMVASCLIVIGAEVSMIADDIGKIDATRHADAAVHPSS
jgi:hypothetical protein